MTAEPLAQIDDATLTDQALFALAKALAQMKASMATGDLAALRRLDPERPDALPFLRLTVAGPVRQFTDRRSEGRALSDALAPLAVMAQLLACGDGSLKRFGFGAQLASADITQSRLGRLLNARGPVLRDIATRLGKQLARQGGDLHLDLARLVIFDGWREDLADETRLVIARDYARAQRKAEAESAEAD